jgi:hypothetical protein
MKRLSAVMLVLLIVPLPSFAKTHKDDYSVSCSVLWDGVKDTLRNSGKYGIISISDKEMSAAFNIGGIFGKRVNSVVLNGKGNGCEMQVQTAYSGWQNNDAGDFKKRVDESLARQQPAQPAAATPPTAPKSN